MPLANGQQLEDEQPLKYKRELVVDGNNSLRRIARVGDRAISDTRTFTESDYILPRDFVDTFADEVKSKKTTAVEEEVEEAEEVEGTGYDGPGDPSDGSPSVSSCTDNWKAASADEKKRMWGVFDETGIFACACRHGLILWLADMVQSGELYVVPFFELRTQLKYIILGQSIHWLSSRSFCRL